MPTILLLPQKEDSKSKLKKGSNSDREVFCYSHLEGFKTVSAEACFDCFHVFVVLVTPTQVSLCLFLRFFVHLQYLLHYLTLDCQ